MIDEKRELLDSLTARDGRLFFTHDPGCALCRLEKNDKGHVVAADPQTDLQGVVA